MRYIFVKSFYLCLHNNKICTTYVEICIKSCQCSWNSKTYLQNRFHCCDNLCQKLFQKAGTPLCQRGVNFHNGFWSDFLLKIVTTDQSYSWSDFEASCMLSQCFLGSVFHMFIQYQYLSINKNETGLKQMSLKYASIHQITPIFRNVHRKHDPEPHGRRMCGYMYNSIIFGWRLTCFENNEDKIRNK